MVNAASLNSQKSAPIEDQRAIGRNPGVGTAFPVGQFRRNNNLGVNVHTNHMVLLRNNISGILSVN